MQPRELNWYGWSIYTIAAVYESNAAAVEGNDKYIESAWNAELRELEIDEKMKMEHIKREELVEHMETVLQRLKDGDVPQGTIAWETDTFGRMQAIAFVDLGNGDAYSIGDIRS